VPDFDHPKTMAIVKADGTRDEFNITHDQARTYAEAAAKKFGVGESHTVKFDPDLAKKDIAGEGDVKQTRKSRAKAAAKVSESTESA
jgi:hypothetical protein